MLSAALRALLVLALAIGGGAWSVRWMLEGGRSSARPSPTLWTAVADPVAADADPYERARMARGGAIALGRAEGVAFVARADADGAPLTAACDYRVEGSLPAARFWTLHARPLPARQAAAGERPPTLHAFQTLRRADGGLAVTVSRHPVSGNWLRVAAAGPIELVLALYDTPAAGGLMLAEIPLPAVSRARCDA